MSTIISVQDIRTSLAAISERAENGESFTVIKNSKPAFRIEPIDQALYKQSLEGRKPMTVHEIRERFNAAGGGKMITTSELEEIIEEVHKEQNKSLEKEKGGF